MSLRARWSGARRLLEELQTDPPEPSTPEHTARGHALDAGAYLLATEVIERLGAVDADLVEGFRQEVTLLEESEHQRVIDDLLNRSNQLRTFDLGEPDLVRPDSSELATED